MNKPLFSTGDHVRVPDSYDFGRGQEGVILKVQLRRRSGRYFDSPKPRVYDYRVAGVHPTGNPWFSEDELVAAAASPEGTT